MLARAPPHRTNFSCRMPCDWVARSLKSDGLAGVSFAPVRSEEKHGGRRTAGAKQEAAGSAGSDVPGAAF